MAFAVESPVCSDVTVHCGNAGTLAAGDELAHCLRRPPSFVPHETLRA
jgi:hypothetical protein